MGIITFHGPGGFATPDDVEAIESCQAGYKAEGVEWSELSRGMHREAIAEDELQLRARVERLKSRHGHREYPWSRTRRFISNVKIKALGDGDLFVTSSFLVYRFRMGDTSPYVGFYEHRLKEVDREFKIHHKKAVLDMDALREHGAVSIIL